MDPASRAFLLTVLRYRTLLATRRHKRDELARLRRLLGERERIEGRSDFEQRAFRRVRLDARAYVRIDGIDAPATIEDLSGSGACLCDDTGIADRIDVGTTGTLHIAPGGSTLRVFLPFEVVHRRDDGRRFGVRFFGEPLVAHQRIAATSAAIRDVPSTSAPRRAA